METGRNRAIFKTILRTFAVYRATQFSDVSALGVGCGFFGPNNDVQDRPQGGSKVSLKDSVIFLRAQS